MKIEFKPIVGAGDEYYTYDKVARGFRIDGKPFDLYLMDGPDGSNLFFFPPLADPSFIMNSEVAKWETEEIWRTVATDLEIGYKSCRAIGEALVAEANERGELTGEELENSWGFELTVNGKRK